MEQLGQRNKSLKRTGHVFAGLLMLGVASGCEAIDEEPGRTSGNLPPAPKVITSTAQAPATPQGTVTSSASTTVPAAPYQTGQYQDTYRQYWKEAEDQGLVVTDGSEPTPSEFTSAYLNQDYSDESTGFNGTTQSIVTDSGQPVDSTVYETTTSVVSDTGSSSTGQYVTADGQPYPETDANGVPVTRTSRPATQYQTASPEYLAGADSRGSDRRSYQAPAPSPSASGGYGVHLASYKVADNAIKGWETLSRQYSVLTGLEARLTEADIPGKGRFLRLKAGPFSSRAAAVEACRSITSYGDYCKVTNFDGVPF
jgi:cell division septation protein DedD